MTAAIKESRYQAVKNNQEYFLEFDFESKKFWTDSPSLSDEERALAKKKSFSLPSDVQVIDIVFKGGEYKTSGEASIRFSKKGYVIPAVIHLGSDDGRKFTFVLSPFLGSVNILENYIQIGDVKL